MKKLVALTALAICLITTALAGSVNLAWDQYPVPTNQVGIIKVYVAPGSNTVFTANNANATVTQSTSWTNTTITITNLAPGWWTFVATAVSTTVGLESDNSNVVGTNVPLRGVFNLKVNASSP